MFEVVSQMIIYLILVAMMGGAIGYLIGRATYQKESDCNEKPKGTHELHIDQKISNTQTSKNRPKPKEVGKKPPLLSAPREGQKDNLQLIKGVGKVLEKLLNDTGIYHFDQIANLTKEEIKWLDNSMAFPGRIEREEWVSQAKALSLR